MTYETEAQLDHGLLKDESVWTPLVAQWIRIRLPMQGTWVWTLIQEDSPCLGAIKPMGHNYWARALGARMPQLPKPLLHNKRSHHNEKLHTAPKSSSHSSQLEKTQAKQQRPRATKYK